MFSAVFFHRGKILQNIVPELIRNFRQFSLKFCRIQLFRPPGMPCVPKLVSVAAKINTDVTDRS